MLNKCLVEVQLKLSLGFAQRIQFLYDRSLNLIIREAKDNGRKALGILRGHYLGKGKSRVIYLYTQLTTLKLKEEESVTDYLIRAETTSTALKSAGETISDSLVMAMIMKGLPDKYATFCAVITQKDRESTFLEFKTALKSFDESEKYRQSDETRENDRIMKTQSFNKTTPKIRCYKCGKPNHKSYECRSTNNDF